MPFLLSKPEWQTEIGKIMEPEYLELKRIESEMHMRLEDRKPLRHGLLEPEYCFSKVGRLDRCWGSSEYEMLSFAVWCKHSKVDVSQIERSSQNMSRTLVVEQCFL